MKSLFVGKDRCYNYSDSKIPLSNWLNGLQQAVGFPLGQVIRVEWRLFEDNAMCTFKGKFINTG